MTSAETATERPRAGPGPAPLKAAAARPETAAPWQQPGAQPHLRLVDVVKRFGDTVAVDGVSLDIYRGEFFALLGPSGCGKTTILRMLAGFETPDSGQILLDGQDLARIPPYERPVNMMFQAYALFPHMTVEKNIAFGLQMEGMPRAEIKRRVDEMLALTHLERQARRRPDQLSGGQRQRVALARALAKKPKLVLLDEPLAALDRKLREATQLELVNIQETLGLTFVIVTHDQEEAMTVSTRLAVMRDGQDRPARAAARRLRGAADALCRRVHRRREHPERARRGPGSGADRASITAAKPISAMPREAPEGGTVELGIRPEKILLERANGEEPAPQPALRPHRGHRLSRQHLGLPRQAGGRRPDPGPANEPLPRRRRVGQLARRGPPQLGRRGAGRARTGIARRKTLRSAVQVRAATAASALYGMISLLLF